MTLDPKQINRLVGFGSYRLRVIPKISRLNPPTISIKPGFRGK